MDENNKSEYIWHYDNYDIKRKLTDKEMDMLRRAANDPHPSPSYDDYEDLTFAILGSGSINLGIISLHRSDAVVVRIHLLSGDTTMTEAIGSEYVALANLPKVSNLPLIIGKPKPGTGKENMRDYHILAYGENAQNFNRHSR